MVSNIPGMPTGSRIEREDEIWAVVAFLTQIQKLDAKAYRDLALGNVHLSHKRCRACDTRVCP